MYTNGVRGLYLTFRVNGLNINYHVVLNSHINRRGKKKRAKFDVNFKNIF